MNYHAYIFCAGLATRWTGVNSKQLIRIGGESLIQRQVRLLKGKVLPENIHIVTWNDEHKIDNIDCINSPACKKIIKTILNISQYWINNNSIFLLGDVYYSDQAIDLLFKDRRPLCFLKRNGGSPLTGKVYGEIYAMKVNLTVSDLLFKKINEILLITDDEKKGNRGKLHDIALKYLINKYDLLISDWTEDFDTQNDLKAWLQNRKLHGLP